MFYLMTTLVLSFSSFQSIQSKSIDTLLKVAAYPQLCLLTFIFYATWRISIKFRSACRPIYCILWVSIGRIHPVTILKTVCLFIAVFTRSFLKNLVHDVFCVWVYMKVCVFLEIVYPCGYFYYYIIFTVQTIPCGHLSEAMCATLAESPLIILFKAEQIHMFLNAVRN
jgi:hypothetical protein